MRITHNGETVEVPKWILDHIATNPPPRVYDLPTGAWGFISQHAVWQSRVTGKVYLDKAVPLLSERRIDMDWLVENTGDGLFISRDVQWGPECKFRWKPRQDEVEVGVKGALFR